MRFLGLTCAGDFPDSKTVWKFKGQVADQGENFYADSAYTGSRQYAAIQETGLRNLVCEKGTKSTLLTSEQQENNREKSRIRARVEHVFAFMEMNMTSMFLYCTGIKRVSSAIEFMNLTYNMFRKQQLTGIYKITLPVCHLVLFVCRYISEI